jgi:hypothetical protein
MQIHCRNASAKTRLLLWRSHTQRSQRRDIDAISNSFPLAARRDTRRRSGYEVPWRSNDEDISSTGVDYGLNKDAMRLKVE